MRQHRVNNPSRGSPSRGREKQVWGLYPVSAVDGVIGGPVCQSLKGPGSKGSAQLHSGTMPATRTSNTCMPYLSLRAKFSAKPSCWGLFSFGLPTAPPLLPHIPLSSSRPCEPAKTTSLSAAAVPGHFLWWRPGLIDASMLATGRSAHCERNVADDSSAKSGSRFLSGTPLAAQLLP